MQARAVQLLKQFSPGSQDISLNNFIELAKHLEYEVRWRGPCGPCHLSVPLSLSRPFIPALAIPRPLAMARPAIGRVLSAVGGLVCSLDPLIS